MMMMVIKWSWKRAKRGANEDHRSYKIKPEKIQALTGIEPMTSSILVQRSYQLSYQANWELSIVSSLYTRGWRRYDKNIWNPYICTAENAF